MKRVIIFFSILYPLYPFWAWISIILLNIHIDKILNAFLIPIAIYYLFKNKIKLPKYLIFFILFTLYHISSVAINDLKPTDTNWIFFILSDFNVLTCTLLIIVENTFFTPNFIYKMNKRIFLVVIIATIVSIIQILNPLFFTTNTFTEDTIYISEARSFSIFSWSYQNSLGITLPFLIAILIHYNIKNKKTYLLLLLGVMISFLSKARYVMISMIVIFFQFILSYVNSIPKKIKYIIIFSTCIIILAIIAINLGFDVQKVIDDRILETGKSKDMSSASARISSYYVFLKKFPENPWFGVGPKTRDDVIKLLEGKAPIIHVGYLSYLYYYGIIGCSLFFSSLYYLLRDAWNIGKKSNFWPTFYGLIALYFANTTMVYFNFSEMGVVLGVIYIRYYKQLNTKQYSISKIPTRITLTENHYAKTK